MSISAGTNTTDPVYSVQDAGIPELGSSNKKGINVKGLVFLLFSVIFLGALFYFVFGSKSTKDTAKQEERLEKPKPLKKLDTPSTASLPPPPIAVKPLVPADTTLTPAVGGSTPISSPKLGPDGKPIVAPISESDAQAISLKQKRMGGQFDKDGKPLPPDKISSQSPFFNPVVTDTKQEKQSVISFGSDTVNFNKYTSQSSADENTYLLKRRATESGEVAIVVGGFFVDKPNVSTVVHATLDTGGAYKRAGDYPSAPKPGSGSSSQSQVTTAATTTSSTSSSKTNDVLKKNLNLPDTAAPSRSPTQPQSTPTSSSSGANSASSLPSIPSPVPSSSLPNNPFLGGFGSAIPSNIFSNPQATAESISNAASNQPRTGRAFPATLARSIPMDPSLYMHQGTLIRCAMQTKLISDLDGAVICLVTENIRSFDSKRILIPKGSKLFGDYKSGSNALDRVSILWSRVITPDNIDIAINSPASDMLGSTGYPAIVDNRWGERIGTALLFSLFTDAFKWGVQQNLPSNKTVTRDQATGNVTVTETPFDSVTVKSANSIVDNELAKKLSVRARLIVFQGAIVTAFTAQDLDFSSVYTK